jgi:hypothetical protein
MLGGAQKTDTWSVPSRPSDFKTLAYKYIADVKNNYAIISFTGFFLAFRIVV